jgi:hypothetical protein
VAYRKISHSRRDDATTTLAAIEIRTQPGHAVRLGFSGANAWQGHAVGGPFPQQALAVSRTPMPLTAS